MCTECASATQVALSGVAHSGGMAEFSVIFVQTQDAALSVWRPECDRYDFISYRWVDALDPTPQKGPLATA